MKIVDQYNLSIINDASHTYKASKSVIDLIITTEDLLPAKIPKLSNANYKKPL